MAKKDNEGGLDIPVTSLAKTDDPGSHASWLKEVTKEHGDTDPLALERRRCRLTAYVAEMDNSLKALQMEKKVFIARSRKEIEAYRKNNPTDPEIEAKIAHMQGMQQQEIRNYGILINQAMFQVASVDAQCLAVDMLSLRDDAESKSGKKGKLRFSSCLYTMDAAEFARKGYKRIKKLHELLAAQNPLIAGALDDSDDDSDDGDDAKYDDQDVLSDDERKQIKKEVANDDEDL